MRFTGKHWALALVFAFILGVSAYRTIEMSRSNAPAARRTAKSSPKRDALQALQKRHRSELKALKRANQSELKAWVKREKEARRQYFAENKEGEKKRAYIQDYIARREAYEQALEARIRELKEKHEHERQVTLAEFSQPIVTPTPSLVAPSGSH